MQLRQRCSSITQRRLFGLTAINLYQAGDQQLMHENREIPFAALRLNIALAGDGMHDFAEPDRLLGEKIPYANRKPIEPVIDTATKVENHRDAVTDLASHSIWVVSDK